MCNNICSSSKNCFREERIWFKYLLPEEYALLGEMTGERHRLLKLDVVVRGAVHEVEHLVVQILDLVVNVGLGVAFVVRRHVRQPHVPLGVCGICATTIEIAGTINGRYKEYLFFFRRRKTIP